MNAALALEAVGAFIPAHDLSEEVVAEGFAEVTVPGRLETVKQASASSAPVILDVAHNPEGVSAMVTSLIEAFAFEKIFFVVGILADKDHVGILTELARVPSAIVLAEPVSARARSKEELAAVAQGIGLEAQVASSVPAAVASAMQSAGPGDLVCVTGSHYVVGEARTHLAGGG
jgi:dihydrofolate synthase/folylpolyglutamate synthase